MDLSNYKLPILDKKATRHNDLMTQIIDMGGENDYRMWCGRTAHLSYQKIQDFILTAKRDGKKPIALFKHLIRKK